MRGFGGLTEAVDALLGSFGVSVQPWFFPALLAAGFVLLFPQIRQNQRTQKARESIRRAADDGGANSEAFQEEMFALANGHPTTLLVICTEAQKRGQLKLARAALHRLEATRKYRTEVIRMRHKLSGPPRVHPEAELAAIEELHRQGLTGMAKTRLERAQRDWPGRPEWASWTAVLSAEE